MFNENYALSLFFNDTATTEIYTLSLHDALTIYFVENINLINGEIENGDWLFSYCGNTVTGSRQWLGKTVDIPAMGAEGNLMTAGYCGMNDTPHFKLLKSKSQELIALHAETPKWQPNGIFFLGSLEEAIPLPKIGRAHV